MKNPAPYIRTQLFSLLNASVTYENLPVPVYESGSEGSEAYKILIAEMTPVKRRTKASEDYTYDVAVEVVYEGYDNVRKHIDAIAEQVMELIQPSLHSYGLQDNDDWQFTGLNINAPVYLDDVSADNKYIKRARLVLNFLITQRQYA